MSSGLYRRQYEALQDIATGLEVSFTNPSGSFNEKFCAMCKIIVEGTGYTFTPVKGGTFTERKSDGLRQVAVSMGAAVATDKSLFGNMLKSARAIWDNDNDGVSPDYGSALDWRVYQYLSHAKLGPSRPELLVQKLLLTEELQAWVTVSDFLDILDEPTIVSGAVQQQDALFTDGTESFYSNADGDTVVDKTFENLLVHYYNTNGSNGLWVKKVSDSVWIADQYALDTTFTEKQYNRNVTYYGAGSGAMRDSEGDLIIDVDDTVIFVHYEDDLTAGSIIPPELIIDPDELFE